MESSYTMDFGGGLVMAADIDLDKLREAKANSSQFITPRVVSGELIPGAIPKYREWMLMINQDAANFVDGKLLWGFQIAPELVQWWEILPNSKGWRQIDMAKIVAHKKGKSDCKKCRGSGSVGRNFLTKQLIACPCTETSERKILLAGNYKLSLQNRSRRR